MKLIKIIPILLSLVLVSVVGCNEDVEVDSIADTDILFSYITDSYHVDFTNESTYTGTYKWEFGDDTESTEENPSHDYSSKGEYYVTLTITGSDGVAKNVFSKVKVDKSSDIDLEDDSFEDWDAIEDAYTANPEHECGVVTNFKYDYDSEFIYFYMKVDVPEYFEPYINDDGDFVTLENYPILDMLIDVDPNDVTDTGFQYTTAWPSFGGGEILLENTFSINSDDYFLDFAVYNPEGTDWDSKWIYDDGQTVGAQIEGAFYVDGSLSEDVPGSTVEVEFAISRTKLVALRGVDIIKIAAWTSDPEWEENGWIPCKMPDDATADTPLADGLVINME